MAYVRKQLVQLVCLLSTIPVVTLAQANEAMMHTANPDGWYVEANVGASRVSNKAYPTGTSIGTRGAAGNLNIGYKLAPYLAVEAGYTKPAKTTFYLNQVTHVAYERRDIYDVVAKAIFPAYTSGFELFGKIGIQRTLARLVIAPGMDSQASSVGLSQKKTNRGGLYMGIGADYVFMPELAGSIQWNYALNDHRDYKIGDTSLLSVGLTLMLR